MYKLLQVMRLDESVYLTTYFNSVGSKIKYMLRDKDCKILRDSFIITINIENNRRALGKLGMSDDQKLFNPQQNKKEGNKLLG